MIYNRLGQYGRKRLTDARIAFRLNKFRANQRPPDDSNAFFGNLGNVWYKERLEVISRGPKSGRYS